VCARERNYPSTAEEIANRRDRAVLVGVDRASAQWPIEESMAELERLAHTAGAEVVDTLTQRLDKPNPRTFIGAGKAEEVAHIARDSGANVVIIDDDLTPTQQANLEDIIPDTKVLDRTQLILDIFALHAASREGKLQVELAQLEYMLPRLRGMWGHLVRERLGGGRGARFGAGESQLETDRRLARKRIRDLKRDLASVARERELQRKQRARSGLFRVSLVGYTNAGKSTLLNALTAAQVLSADMLFATLDSTTRRLALPEGRGVTLTDTVGFIHKLPHGLVEAFKSTLDEVSASDLLLHVTDASASHRDAQMQAVREVLHEIDAHRTRQLVVFNKLDLIGQEERALLARRHPAAVLVSAQTGEGIDSLLRRVAEEAARDSVTLTVLVPYTRGEIVKLAHERAQVLSETHTPHGTRMMLRAPTEIADTFDDFALSEEGSAVDE